MAGGAEFDEHGGRPPLMKTALEVQAVALAKRFETAPAEAWREPSK